MTVVPHPKGRRYSVPVMVRAQELRDAEWTLDRIADFLQREFGVRPSIDTIAIWTDPRRAASSKRVHGPARRRYRNQTLTGRMPNAARHSKDFQEIRARSLVAAGADPAAVADIMDFDYPRQRWTPGRVTLLTGAATSRPAPTSAARLARAAAAECAAELRRKGWKWSAIALAMTEYHGQPVLSGEIWRATVHGRGIDVPKREMTPARSAQLQRLHEANRAAVAA